MNEDLYIWGTGCGAGELLDNGLEIDRVRGFVDSEPLSDRFMGREVISPKQLSKREYALVIVTSRCSEEIRQCAKANGIAAEKLLFLKNHYLLTDMNTCGAIAAKLLGEKLMNRLCPKSYVVRESWLGGATSLEKEDLDNDYVRVKTLEAICRRLDDVPGCAAELGVYKGGFARCINALLPERKLYLFDTFQGFDPKESEREREKNRIGEAFTEAHKNTSIERVLKVMPHPEMLVTIPGLFPESLKGLEEHFALVSIDVDLEESILAGLNYFVPRLSPGGYIFLHDYNSPSLLGVRSAVERYEKDKQIRLHALPLCDVNGSLVICG